MRLYFENEPVNDGERYLVTITEHFHQGDYVVYQAEIRDQAFQQLYQLHFRYKKLRALSDQLLKRKQLRDILPEFPKTNSVVFWNRTNSDPKSIENRKRELQYFLSKIMNHPILSQQKETKSIISRMKCVDRVRAYSQTHRKSIWELSSRHYSEELSRGRNMEVRVGKYGRNMVISSLGKPAKVDTSLQML